MIEVITVGLTGACLAVVVPIFLKFGRTLTRIEVKMDALLNHYGIGWKT